jgi:hypothetical protein
MCDFRIGVGVVISLSVIALACGGPRDSAVGPSPTPFAAPGSQEAGAHQPSFGTRAAHPPFDLEAVLRGDGFGLVKFRQAKDSTQNIIDLDVWVRDLSPNTSYSLQRATDTTLDDVCTGTNWLTLGQGPAPQAIVTDDRGTGRASLWRDLSSLSPDTAFDIHFRVIPTGTSTVVLESDCYRFLVRD